MIRFFISFIFLVLLVEVAGISPSQDVECQPTSCGISGPIIRFPFRLKGRQAERCGYPGFELSCTESHETELELQFPVSTLPDKVFLPNMSVKVSIGNIDYKAQMIYVIAFTAPANYCLPEQPPTINPSTPPIFRLGGWCKKEKGYTLFNCSSNKPPAYLVPVSCLNTHNNNTNYKILAVEDSDPVPSCYKIYSISYVPDSVVKGQQGQQRIEISLHWSKPSYGKKGAPGKLIAGIVIGVLCMFFLTITLYRILISKIRNKEFQKKIEGFLEDYVALRPTRYTYADMKKITNNFENQLGQGGYGIVYKGKISNEILVAVKVLKDFKGNGEEFINEVSTIGRIHHVNVVRLLGYCADQHRRALVYEFLPNDSLEKFVSLGYQNRTLDWEKLHEIAIGIAKGLEYLHQGCSQRILHFDIKPHNILLDHNFNPKVADFGLAKLCSKDQNAVSMTVARGTIGYIAPEVFSRNYGSISYKADVYSFGMLLVDMVGGKKKFRAAEEENSQIYFPEWMYNQLEKGKEIEIQTERAEDSKIVRKLTIVGLWCIQWYPAERPSMKEVIQMLEAEEMPIMPPNPYASRRTDTNLDSNEYTSGASAATLMSCS